jgi:hypothetical protein
MNGLSAGRIGWNVRVHKEVPEFAEVFPDQTGNCPGADPTGAGGGACRKVSCSLMPAMELTRSSGAN